MGLSENLRRYREQAGYTMQEFSHMVNVPYGTYNSYETTTKVPRLDKLIKIADTLNVSLDDLVGRTPKSENEQLKKDIELATSAINEHNAPFTIWPYSFNKDTINLAFGHGKLQTGADIDGIEISKQDIAKAINEIDLQTDTTRRRLLFERLALLGLDEAKKHCEKILSEQQKSLKDLSEGKTTIRNGFTGELASVEKIQAYLKTYSERIEKLRASQEKILAYQKALQDFISSK